MPKRLVIGAYSSITATIERLKTSGECDTNRCTVIKQSNLDEVLYMPIGQEVLFRRGQRPIVTRRYDIQKNDVYQKVTKDYNKRMANQER